MAEAPPSLAIESGKASARILLLEDSTLDAELTLARLSKAGIHPALTLARNREEFEAAVELNCYDLILADYALPDYDGIAALALAREKCPGCPFIFISGRVGEEVAIDTLQRGATDYVLKHRLERLIPAVLRALRESEEHSIRVRAEANYRQSELRFRHVIEAVPQMIWVASADGALSYSNQAWRDYVPPGVARWCEPALFHPEDYEALSAAWQAALDRGEPFSAEVRFLRHSDGSYRWHLLRLTPMDDIDGSGDGEVSWLGAATDLQDQKRNEEALRTAEKLSVTGRMAASIAHEINNPLESLTNLLFLVRLETEENDRARAYLDMTENELERISTITKQTLQFYRDPSSPVPVNARELLEEVLRLFASRLSSKGIESTFRIEAGLEFEAIKGEIRQVLINLVNNAIDAVPVNGRIDIEAHPVEVRAGEPGVEMLVHDNGSGITPEQAARLFTPFFSTKGTQGTGLGLWVSMGIVEKHGGTIELGTQGKAGSQRTTARVVLPVKAVPELQPASGETASTISPLTN